MAVDKNPITNFKFIVNLGDGESTFFQEVILPDSEVEIIEYRDGSDVLSSSRKISGRTKYTNLILKRGLVRSQELFDWFKQSKQGAPDLRDITISILNQENEPFATWKLRNCWPTKYFGLTLNSTQSGVVIETIEIATEEIDLEIN